MIGRTIADLEIIELVGLGAAAEVYRALERRTGREVAVKVLSERAEPDMVRRFMREAEALARLHHPHIVEVYRSGEDRGARYLVMELVRGGSLKERLQAGKLPWREAVRIAIQVAQALGHAHEHGIIHRDIKPGNVLFDEQGEARLSDFGLAHVDDAMSMTRTGAVMGTVLYMPPEQATGQPVGPPGDLYALGAVLYEMVTGQTPFSGPSAVSVLYKHINEQPQPIRKLDESLPVALEAVIERLLQKDPVRRFPNAQETIEALNYALNADQAQALPDSIRATELAEERAAPLVGREQELQQLLAALERAVTGAGQTVFVAGQAGIGKTRLASELAHQAQERNVLTLMGDCLYGDAPDPYAPLVEMVRAYEASAPLYAPDSGDGLAGEIQASLEDLRAALHLRQGRASQDGWMQQLSLEDAQARLFDIVSRFFVTLSRQRALLLILDDLQWASPTTLQLLHYLARNARGARILLLGLYRVEEILPGAGEGPHPLQELLRRMGREHLYQEISLHGLRREQISELAANALNLSDIDEALVDLLSRESEGNAFYLLETLRWLQEQGNLAWQDDHWELVTTPAQIEVPPTVLDIILRRVERTTDQEHELLDWGAILGQRLDAALLAELLGWPTLSVMKRLYALEQRHGLLASDENGFFFGHAKIREALYQEMPPPLRRESHLLAGKTLEALAADDLERVVYDLAHHFYQGGDKARALRYALAAADKAEAAFAPLEALGYLERTLELLAGAAATPQTQAQQLRLQHRCAHLLSTVGKQGEACNAFERALEQSRALGEQRTEAELLIDLAVVRGRVGDWESALSLGEQSLTLAKALGDAERQASALLSTGFFQFERGDWEPAVQRLRSGLEIAQGHGLELWEARLLGNLGILYNTRGSTEEAIGMYRQSIATFARLGQTRDAALGYSNLGFSYHQQGDYAQARECYAQALELLTKVGDVREEGLVHLHMAETALAVGQLAETRDECARATRIFARLGFDLGLADVDRVYAGIARRERNWAVAEHYLRSALAVYEEYQDPLNLAETHAELGRLLDEAGEAQRGAQELERSRTIFERLHGEDGSSLAS
jgi:tetratricopeptide (TPR) repeat protein